MDENKKEFGTLSDLAEIAEKLLLVHRGKCAVVFELDKEEYLAVLNMFREVDRKSDKFKIDISGVEFIYILKSDEN